MRRVFLCVMFAVGASMMMPPTLGQAAMMNYGDFGGSTVDFIDVTEDNLVSSLFYDVTGTVGDALVIDPDGFEAQSNPGPGAAFVDSGMRMVIAAKPGHTVDQISFSEEGEYSIVGIGNVDASVAYFWQITEVDGTPITPVSGNGTADFTANTPTENGLWNVGFTVDLINGLTNAGLSGAITTAVFRFDNSLTATAANDSSMASINKNPIGGVKIMVPEPSGVLAQIVGLIGLLGYRRR